MTYKELCRRLCAAGIESAEWDAALLLEHFCGADALALRAEPERDHSSPLLDAAVRQREARYPLQYLLGEWEFYRQKYEVSPDCLIPRSDTEILVEEAIRTLPRGALFADLCTGSGCIAISILAERPDTRALAVEKFAPTLDVAIRNAARNGVADRFTPILADVLEKDLRLPERVDAILSNPPYIPSDQISTLSPELSSEPRVALDGGEDGLIFYREILNKCDALLAPGGTLLFEIGFDQADALTEMSKAHGFASVRVLRDLGGNCRVVSLEGRGA